MHILLIEPNKVLAATYVMALTDVGHTVSHAHTAQTAVAMADEKKPNLVILELQMARHNGVEFLYEFKSYPEWRRIPVIILSVLPLDELEELTVLRRELSVSSILSKTQTTLNDLCQAVAKLEKPRR